MEETNRAEEDPWAWFNDVKELARRDVPFGEFFRNSIMLAYKLRLGDSSDSIVCDYESSLSQHKQELLSRQDLNPKVRSYIWRYIK